MVVVRVLAATLAALLLASAGEAARRPSPSRVAAPQGLKAFLLRADEPAQHVFSRTPSFAWKPVRGAYRYEFELSTSPRFTEAAIVWSDSKLTSAAVAIPMALPWMTGSPYALYGRVRAITRRGASPWSSSYGFNMRWTMLPTPVTPAFPGLVRWGVVDGATSYHVWFLEAKKVIATRTTAADLREYYTFHQGSPWVDAVRWRVRAVRTIYGAIPSGLPAVSYGPWSPVYTTTNSPSAGGALSAVAALATRTSDAQSRVLNLTPAFAFTGNLSLAGATSELYRVYVFTDRDCVNIVFRGAIVGSPAYAPRATGPLDLPKDNPGLLVARTRYLPDGEEGKTTMADTAVVRTTESDPPPAAPQPSPKAKPGDSGGGDQDTGEPTTPPSSSLPSTPSVKGAPVDLWDSGWPNGHYYWTVVPVNPVLVQAGTTITTAAVSSGATTFNVASSSGFVVGGALRIGKDTTEETRTIVAVSAGVITVASALQFAHPAGDIVRSLSDAIEYADAEMPQDACAAGRVLRFGKESEPVVTGSTAPYASGLSPTGRLLAASTRKPAFYGYPLVAWQPALGADQYQLQWSRTRYPWNPVGQKLTYSTAMLLPLKPGRWYYRVRGINFALPGTARAMTWSNPVELRVVRPTFAVVRG